MLHFPQNLNVKSLISACLFVREAEQRAFVPTSNRKGGFLVFSEATTFAEKKVAEPNILPGESTSKTSSMSMQKIM